MAAYMMRRDCLPRGADKVGGAALRLLRLDCIPGRDSQGLRASPIENALPLAIEVVLRVCHAHLTIDLANDR